jgi:uncharacterized protein YcsI (UPF0317 family)
MLRVGRSQSFIRYFTDVDLVDVEFTFEGNRIAIFRINYRAFILGAWHEVVRYDNAHGNPLHIHRFWPPPKGAKDYLETEPRSDYTDAVEAALADLDANWSAYRRRVEKEARRGR